MFEYIDECTKSLHELGIKRDDCVTLCTAGIPEAIYLVLACSRIGAIANFINPLFPREQKIDRINDTGATWLFVLDEMYSYIEDTIEETCIEKIVVIPATNSIAPVAAKALYLKSKARKILSEQKNKEYISWNSFLQIGRNYTGQLDSDYVPDTPAVMVYSSGSTGASKGIMLTNDGINATVLNYRNSGFIVDRSDSFLQMNIPCQNEPPVRCWLSHLYLIAILEIFPRGPVPEPLEFNAFVLPREWLNADRNAGSRSSGMMAQITPEPWLSATGVRSK